ncbi:hypothetical protein PC128_g4623 [Phytophthora cactorum]|nr:hypothetical protein PC128_g4623 [Phytophthora cactorum]
MEKSSLRSSSLTLLVELCPCLFYFMCSLTMNLLTKTLRVFAVVTGTEQQSSVDPVGFKHRGVIYVLRVLLPLMALHLSNMLLGFASLQVVNLPMYLVLRRLTTITVMLIEWLVLHKAISGSIKMAILVSSAGSLIAGSTDVMSDGGGGYTLVLLQNLCTAMSLALSKESALTPRQLVILNSIAGAVCCSVLGFIFERDKFSVQFCTLHTSALTTSVTGNIKDLFATVGGYLLFPDAPTHFANFVGVALSFIGAYSFSYIRYRALVGPSPPHQKQL